MFDFAKKLLFARELKMERGNMQILGQNVAVFPVHLFNYFIENNSQIIPLIYNGGKESATLFAKELMRRYNFKSGQIKDWLKNIIEFAGWGEAEFIKYDQKHHIAVLRVRNSSLALHSKRKEPVDHLIRGFFAGGGKVSMNAELDCIETRCIAKNDNICEFIVAEKSFLMKKYPNLTKNQL